MNGLSFVALPFSGSFVSSAGNIAVDRGSQSAVICLVGLKS
jgi:hypothetical protein